MRLIDGDKLIEKANKDGAYGYVSVKDIADAPTIEQYGTWIPCSERLPEEDGSYMTTTEYGAVRVNHFYPRNKTWGHKSNRTIAWMPLPEPYREEKKDEQTTAKRT